MTDSGIEPRKPKGLREVFALVGFFCLTPVAAVAGGLAMAPLQALAALIGIPWRRIVRLAVSAWIPLALLAAFAAWAIASMAWSPYDGTQPLRTAGGLLAGVLFAATAHEAARTRRTTLAVAALACVGVMALLLSIEALADMPLNRLFNDEPNAGVLARNPAKGVSLLVVMVWGAAAASFGAALPARIAWRLALLATLALSLQFDQNANFYAFVAGFVAFVAGVAAPGVAPVLLGLGIAGWLLAAPVVMAFVARNEAIMSHLPASWRMRGQIWEFAIARIQEKPVTGWGVDASRTFQGTGMIDGMPFNISPLHPHSFSLHVWEETGLVGAVLLAAAIAAAGLAAARAYRADKAAAAAWCGGMAATFAIWNVSYGAWQEWWVTTPFLVLALAAAARGGPTSPAEGDRDP